MQTTLICVALLVLLAYPGRAHGGDRVTGKAFATRSEVFARQPTGNEGLNACLQAIPIPAFAASARACDRSQLDGYRGVRIGILSVCPVTSTFPENAFNDSAMRSSKG